MKATGLEGCSLSLSVCVALTFLSMASSAQVVSEAPPSDQAVAWLDPLTTATSADSATATPTPRTPLSWRVTARDGCSTTHEATEWVTNALTGAATEQPHRYIEVSSGLNFLNAAGEWVESQDLIELTPDGGAAALRGPAKVRFNANLNTAGAITLTTRSNRVLRTHLLGLAYYDASSGKAVIVSGLKPAVSGELLPPNQIVFKSAFTALEADVLYTYTKAAFECDVILKAQPPSPALFGLDPVSTRLEVWHEWLGAPAPRVKSRLLARETDETLRSRMVEPDFQDQILDFGDAWFPTGAAFLRADAAGRSTNALARVRVPNLTQDRELSPVGKTWLPTPQGTLLIEAVRWPEVQPKLAGLAPASAGISLRAPQDRLACLNQLTVPGPARLSDAAIQVARTEYRPAGCVLDYITVDGYQDYTFTNATYLVGYTYFGGTVAIRPGAILKYEDWGQLFCYGAFDIQAVAWAILTSKDENFIGSWQVGEPIGSGCPTYSAYVALWSYYQSAPVEINGAVIRWARTAVQLDANYDWNNPPYYCSGLTHKFWDSGIELCETGIYVNNGVCDIGGSYYAWQCGVNTPTAPYPWECTYFTGEFLTSSCSGTAPPPTAIPPPPVTTCRNQAKPITLTGLDTCSGACSGELAFTIVQQPSHGQLGTITPLDGTRATVIYTPSSTPSPGFCGTDHFTFKVTDCLGDSDTAEVTVNVGDPNVAAVAQTVMTGIGTPIVIPLCGSDQCGDDLSFDANQPEIGVLTGGPNPVTYTPEEADPPFTGLDHFTFTASNCSFESSPATVTVVVVPGLDNLMADCRPRSITLSWDPSDFITAFGLSVDGFKVYRSTTQGGPPSDPYILLTPVPLAGTERTFTDTSVAPNMAYFYVIKFIHNEPDCQNPGEIIAYESPFSNGVEMSTCCPDSQGPFWTDLGGTAQEMAEWIMAGSGISVVPNSAAFEDAALSIPKMRGIFGNGGDADLPIESGVILCSGDIGLAQGPNNNIGEIPGSLEGSQNGDQLGDSALNGLVPGLQTRDAAALTFDVTAPADNTPIEFKYVFASEEYHFYIGQINDIMAIWVDGENIAVVPGSSPPEPVAVNNIHNGKAGTPPTPPKNPDLFVDNETSLPGPLNIQYNGLTVLLTTTNKTISTGSTHHVKIAIADATDQKLDSAIFIKASSPCQ